MAVIQPIAAWRAHVTVGQKGYYALHWTDLILEGEDRVLFLHFSFSD